MSVRIFSSGVERMSLSKIFLRFSSSPNVISLKGNGIDGFAVVAVVAVVDILDGSFSEFLFQNLFLHIVSEYLLVISYFHLE